MQLIHGTPVFGTPEHGALSQIQTCAKTAAYTALMADHHKGYAVPIGGVVAYEGAISPSGVGFDIGCGNKAVRVDVEAGYVRDNIEIIMNYIFKTISFGMGRNNNNEPVAHEILERDYPGWELEATKPLKRMAATQLGTVGSGNHYVDIFTDEYDRVWIGVHFGSRGLGHKTATWFLKAAGARDGMDVAPCVLPVNSDLGAQYIVAMELAGQYAYAGRTWVCNRVAQILGGQILEEVHNHHNFAWKEEHFGKWLWVVRKGATPAFPGQQGFVGGSMGEPAVIIEGVEHELCKPAMYSTVHGAGRVMGRREAKRTLTEEQMQAWLQKANVVLRGGGLDESPDCYKRLTDVLAAHSETIRVLHTLTPLGVAMAGSNEFDPYKD